MEKNFNVGVIFMELYRKPIITTYAGITGIVPLAAVGAAATTAVEVAAGVAAVLGFLTGLGDKDFHPEHMRTLAARKNFALE